MKINFTKKQYLHLMKLAFLGEYVVNGIKEPKDMDIEFRELSEYIYSFAKDFNYDEYIDKDGDNYYVTRAIEDNFHKDITEFEDFTFWEELVHRLAKKNFVARYGKEKISKMSDEERIEKDHPFLEKYYEEIDKNGLNNIDIKS